MTLRSGPCCSLGETNTQRGSTWIKSNFSIDGSCFNKNQWCLPCVRWGQLSNSISSWGRAAQTGVRGRKQLCACECVSVCMCERERVRSKSETHTHVSHLALTEHLLSNWGASLFYSHIITCKKHFLECLFTHWIDAMSSRMTTGDSYSISYMTSPQSHWTTVFYNTSYRLYLKSDNTDTDFYNLDVQHQNDHKWPMVKWSFIYFYRSPPYIIN